MNTSETTGGMDKGDRLTIFVRFLLILIFLAAPLLQTTPAAAQEGSVLLLSTPEVSMFPTVRFQLDGYDARGAFLDNLSASNVQLLEDGQVLQPQAVEKIVNGMQTLLVINTSPAMDTNNGGITEYQRLQQHLVQWSKSQQSEAARTDDYSLATPSGLFLIREEDPAALMEALNKYQPDLVRTQPSLTSLTDALDLATDPLNQPFMKRAILYITPPLPAETSLGLADLVKRAKGIGVRINVWQITPTASQGPEDPLRLLAQETGGKYAEITPTSPLPDITSIFQPLRYTYQVTYTSKMTTSGQHSLQVQFKPGEKVLTSNKASFALTVTPPNPIFIDPPVTVTRGWTTTKGIAPALSPEEISLTIMVEFPDQHRRDLKVTRLFVDDVLVAENTSEPFDQFTLPIAAVTTSKRQILRVEAVDTLDLTGTSIEVPVEIIVELPAKNRLVENLSENGLIALGAMTAAGAVLALVMVLTGSRRKLNRKKTASERKAMKDPLTQPVAIRQDAPRSKKASPGSSWMAPIWSRTDGHNAPAHLIALDDNEQPLTGGIIPLSRQEITFGSDPRRATQVLESPTIDGLHARLNRSDDDEFVLCDQNSIAGTWVNYAPVTTAGARLEHGDLVHIGKAIFRFEFTDPARVPTIEVTVLELEKPV